MLFPLINKNDKIMITGSKGNLGGQLMKVLGNEYRLVLFDKDNLDLRDQEKVKKAARFHKPDFIINTAAYNAVDNCEEELEFKKAKELNQLAVRYLAEASLENKAVFIHFSTDYVFGGYSGKDLKRAKRRGGFDESDPPKPGNNYAESKFLGEEEIKKISGKGLRYYLVRTSKLFGPKGESELAKPSFFDLMLGIGRDQKKASAVHGEYSCFTYTYDLALAVKSLIEEKKEYGIYHIANQGSATWYDGAKCLFELYGLKAELKKISPLDLSRPAKRPEYSVLRNTKLRPLRHYREALKHYLENFN